MARPLIDLVEELENIDPFHVANKEDGYYYCWLNKKPENIQRMKDIFGYEILGAKHNENALSPPNAVGERVYGDVILARMPKERYEKLMRLKKRKAENQVNAANDAWKDKAERSGLLVEDSTKRTSEIFKAGEGVTE